MSRLASLTPTRQVALSSPSPSSSSASPTRIIETTHHRMLRLLLAEVRNLIQTWDELVSIDGLKAGKACVNEATEMDNILQLEETPERPTVGPHLDAWYTARAAMETVMRKLDKLLSKLSLLVDQAEKILFEAYRSQGVDFTLVEPLWLTWTLEQFINSLSHLIPLHNHHLHQLSLLAAEIMDPTKTFDDAKLALEHWQDLSQRGERWEGVREWEELIEVELIGLGEKEEREEEDATRKGRRKARKG